VAQSFRGSTPPTDLLLRVFDYGAHVSLKKDFPRIGDLF